jgi:hypothetical protein
MRAARYHLDLLSRPKLICAHNPMRWRQRHRNAVIRPVFGRSTRLALRGEYGVLGRSRLGWHANQNCQSATNPLAVAK